MNTATQSALNRVQQQRTREAAKAALAGEEITFGVKVLFGGEDHKLYWISAKQNITQVIAGGSQRQMEALLVDVQRQFGAYLASGCKEE